MSWTVIVDNLITKPVSISNEKLDVEYQQKKIENEINEILRNIEISYEVIDPGLSDASIYDIELNEIEVIDPELSDASLNDIKINDIEYVNAEGNHFEDSNNEISFGLFSSDNFSANNSETEPFSESDNEFNHKEEEIEFIKSFDFGIKPEPIDQTGS